MTANVLKRWRHDNWVFELFCIGGLVSIVGAVVFKDYLLFHKLYIFKDTGSDTYSQLWPFYVHISEYIRTEGIPKWSFNQGMGQNIFPAGLNNPFDLALVILGNPKLLYGIAYIEFFKVVLGGIIFYFYARLIPLSRFAALVGGLAFAFSGYMIVGSGWHTQSTAVLYGVFLLFSFEKLFMRDSWVYLPVSVALLGSYSAFLLYTFGFFILCYTVFRFFDEKGFQWKALARLLIRIAGLTLLGVLIGSVFIIPDILKMLQSPRVSSGFGYFNELRSLPVFHFADKMHYVTAVLRFFSNDILGTGRYFRGWGNYLEAPAFYCGTITLLLFPQVFRLLNKQRKTIYTIFALFWAMIIVFPFLRHAVYLFSGDYYRSGVSFFIPIVMLFFGMRALSGIDESMELNAPLLIATTAALIIILNFPYFSGINSPVVSEIRIISTMALIVFTVLIYLLSLKGYRRFTKILILILLCIEIGTFSYITANKRWAVIPDELYEKVGYNDYTVEAIKYLKGIDAGFYRINKNYSSCTVPTIRSGYNDAQLQGYYGTSSYYSFNQKGYIDFLVETGIINRGNENETRWAKGLGERPFLQTIASVKYCLSKGDDLFCADHGYEEIGSFGDVKILKNLYFLPLGFTYDRFMTSNEFKSLNNYQKDLALLNAFIVDAQNNNLTKGMDSFEKINIRDRINIDDYKKVIRERREETMRIIQHGQNYIKGSVDFRKRKLLFFSIPYDKGWSVFVDGRKKPLQLVNIGFMGVDMDKGEHTIELIYSPPYIITGTIVSAVAFFSYFLMIAAQIRKKSNTNKI